MKITSTLWSTPNKTRQFIVPNNESMPSGNLVLRTPTGRELLVDPEAIKPFEVTNEEANAWLKEQLQNVTRQLGDNLRVAFSRSPRQSEAMHEGKTGEAVTDGGKSSTTTPGLDLLADITGTPREGLTGDYRAIGRALRAYFGDIASTVGDAVSGEAQKEAMARERMQAWGETLRRHGINVPESDEEKGVTDNADQVSTGSKPDEDKD